MADSQEFPTSFIDYLKKQIPEDYFLKDLELTRDLFYFALKEGYPLFDRKNEGDAYYDGLGYRETYINVTNCFPIRRNDKCVLVSVHGVLQDLTAKLVEKLIRTAQPD